ncbi:MAG: TorF family putative porin [Pseudomonas sp.]
MIKRILLPLSAILLAVGCSTQTRVLEREVGDFDLKLGTAPTRSMAHGLIEPTTVGAFHGGLDLTHASGWYAGQWSPSAGITDGTSLQVNSYAGFLQQSMDDSPGYELGLIHLGFPELEDRDRDGYYAGLNLAGRRLGLALNAASGRTDSTLFLDIGSITPFSVGVKVKYGRYALENPHYLPGNRSIETFSDWSLNISRPWLGIQLDLFYSDSSLTGAGCEAYSGQNAQCDALLMFRAERQLY